MGTRSDSHGLWKDGMMTLSRSGPRWGGERARCTGGRLISSDGGVSQKTSIGETVTLESTFGVVNRGFIVRLMVCDELGGLLQAKFALKKKKRAAGQNGRVSVSGWRRAVALSARAIGQ